MTLEQLGMQYLEEEKRIRERIKELRELFKNEPDRDLEMRITDLYTTAINLHSTGEYLINYYKKEQEDVA